MAVNTLEGESIQLLTEERPGEGGERVSILGAFLIQACLLELQAALWKGQVTYLKQKLKQTEAKEK